ncbi:MAG: hypothetical protein ACM3SU_08640 [Acidobacteriota bacterium]
MRRRPAGLAVLLVSMATACAREKSSRAPAIPPGDAVWFTDGIGADLPQVEQILARGGLARVFLPALSVGVEAGAWKTAAVSPPPRPLASLPVVLVIRGGAAVPTALSPGSEPAAAAAIGAGIKSVLGRRAAFGRVEGMLLDLPFPEAAAETYGKLVEELRPQLPSDLFLIGSLRFVPAEKGREDFVRRLRALDGFAAFVFGQEPLSDPVATEALGKPWWATYAPAAKGEWTDASGNRRGTLAEESLRELTDDARVPLGNDLALRQEGTAGFIFQPAAPVETGGVMLSPGDRIAFRQPLISELLYRFGSDLAGRHLVRGRLVALSGTSDSERLFTLPALSDVLLGHPLLPDLRVAVAADASGVRIAADNASDHASIVSRTANWVEVDVPFGHIRDVVPGGFDRYEVFDADGRPVTPGRATRVRFYETLVAPRERIEEAAILVRIRPPADCCRFRSHVLAASGTEVAGDWVTPPPAPTPTPIPKRRPPKRR